MPKMRFIFFSEEILGFNRKEDLKSDSRKIRGPRKPE